MPPHFTDVHIGHDRAEAWFPEAQQPLPLAQGLRVTALGSSLSVLMCILCCFPLGGDDLKELAERGLFFRFWGHPAEVGLQRRTAE